MKSVEETQIKSSLESVYEYINIGKTALLDSAGVAGVIVFLLFAFNADPLNTLNNSFITFFIIAAVIVIVHIIFKSFLNGGFKTKQVIEFVCHLLALLFMWIIVVKSVLIDYSESVEKESVNNVINALKSEIETEIKRSQNQVSSDISSNTMKIEEFQIKLNELMKDYQELKQADEKQ